MDGSQFWESKEKIVLDPHLGSDIGKVCTEAYHRIIKEKKVLEFSFNGILVRMEHKYD